MPKLKLKSRCVFIVGISIFLAACSVPKSMQVRTGGSPAYQDDDVRFQTTYYFRVIPKCSDTVDVDSLYRFRMTGKSAEFNQIHFESGILDKNIIDPFGAVVSYDAESTQFHVSSHEDMLDAGRQKASWDQRAREQQFLLDQHVKKQRFLLEERDYKRKILFGEINDYLKLNGITTIDKITDGEIKKIFTANIEAVIGLTKNLIQNVDGVSQSIDTEELNKITQNIKTLSNGITKLDQNISELTKKIKDAPTIKQASCENDQHGFQVWGPQGMITFDQNKRLLLAMSSSAKPLISTLNELAARMRPRPTNNMEALLHVTEERLTLSRTERELSRLENEISISNDLEKFPADPIKLINTALEKLGTGKKENGTNATTTGEK